MPKFEANTQFFIKHTGRSTPEGDLVFNEESTNGIWQVRVVETPAGDRKMVILKNGLVVLSFFPNLVTANMFPIDEDLRTFQRLPEYVKRTTHDFVTIANILIKP